MRIKKKIYIYPHTARGKDAVPNPYLHNLLKSMQEYYTFINFEKRSNTGIMDILKYYTKLDYIMLNWIENLPDKKRGIFQSIFFIILLMITSLSKKKIIWTMHNKVSHDKKFFVLKNLLFTLLISHSDYIITHSKEGIEYLENINHKKMYKLKYIPHPVTRYQAVKRKTQEYDILIWGTIIAYKGIDSFLELLSKNQLLDKHRILIIGKAHSNEYFNKLLHYSSEKITIENKFIPENELKELISRSKSVLFTYFESSVLSSGVLMDTLSYGARIIGPHSGAFKDMAEEKLITTYKNADDLVDLLYNFNNIKDPDENRISGFISENSWDNYAKKLYEWIK